MKFLDIMIFFGEIFNGKYIRKLDECAVGMHLILSEWCD